MALAILELLDYDDTAFQFQIDTGTNSYYQLKAGTGVGRELGIDLVEDVYLTTPMARNESSGDLLNSATEVSIPGTKFDRPNTYVQLFSYKSPDRKSPAVSKALRVPVGLSMRPRGPSEYAASFSRPQPAAGTVMTKRYHAPRSISFRTAPALARQTSFDQILGEVLKLAAPIVQDLLKGVAGSGATSSGTTGGGANGPAGILGQILQALLGQATAGSQVSQPHSRSMYAVEGNRFSRQMVFGIDDALLGAAIGQIVGILPQLANAANSKRIELKKADNLLTTGILSDVNKRLMLDKLVELQKQPPAANSPTPDQIQQAIALLQQAQAAQIAPVAETKSLPYSARAYSFSNRATLSFELGAALDWNGAKYPIFGKSNNLLLKVRLTVGEPAPKTALPKALLKIVWKDPTDLAVTYEKTFKRKDVLAGDVFECPFEVGELAHLPVGKPLAVAAELRWLAGKTSREVRALGSTEIVLVKKYFLKDAGKETGEEIELRDMKLYRSFWNKVWEAPVLDAATPTKGYKKYNWELDANCRFSIVFSATHDSNGFMEPKVMLAKSDPNSLSQKTEGRIKAGIELSISELNKLQSLWRVEPINPDQLEAFAAGSFLDSHAVEFIRRFKLKGKAGQRGMLWVIPVFKMFGFKLANASLMDGVTGQVTSVTEEDTHLPLPVAARVIGLKAKNY